MNRLEQWLKSAAVLVETAPDLAESPDPMEQAPPREEVQFFLPEHYEAGYAYPLVVWLHGSGEDEQSLCSIMPELSTRNYVGVAPRGGCMPSFGPGFGWSDTPLGLEMARERILTAVGYAQKRANIAAERIFLAGRGEGGSMALRIALSAPSQFGGVLSFGGGLPRGNGLLSRYKEARSLPIFLAVGGESLEYPTDQLCDDLRLCHLAWLQVAVKLYQGCGDELMCQMMSDANAWMMEQVTGRLRSVSMPAER